MEEPRFFANRGFLCAVLELEKNADNFQVAGFRQKAAEYQEEVAGFLQKTAEYQFKVAEM